MISVCLASYNGELYIKEQIDSILPQLSDKDEIVISDDSSSDSTVKILMSYEDARIKIHKNHTTKSPVFNFENALKHAKGDYIFLCDQDDIWLPNKVRTTIPFFDKYDLIVSDCKVVDERLDVLENSFFDSLKSGEGFWKNFTKNTYLGCCMAFKKEILDYALPFPSKIAMHDIWIGLLAELSGNPFFLKEQLILYRRHNNNVSFGGGKSKNSLLFRIKYRILLLIDLMNRKLSYTLRKH
jgi:glycosyltransferase involved in cell wall biosynthesis